MNESNRLLILIFLIKCLVEETDSICPNNTLEIQLPQGKIKGSYNLFGTQRQFLGIPYATVEGRFEAPGKAPTWNTTLVADQGMIKCKQYHIFWKIPVGQEDCLVLNIFTPTPQSKKPLPVMVFIHGGGFYWGSNTDLVYNPYYLVEKEVIVVTINYRLGAFGFLCLDHKEAPGNSGLKDQIAALKWVQKNIIYFGGDPNCVTLFGQSVGAISINHLILSYSAKGLFHRAILQSGTILTSHAFSYTPIESASKVAKRLGYNTSDPEELLKIFKNSTADDIVEASYVDPTNNVFAPYIFKPCVETAITKKRPLITSSPKDLLKRTGLNISVIIGFNNKEGIYWGTHYHPITIDKIKQNLKYLIPDDLLFKNNDEKSALITEIESIYFENGTAQDNLIDYFTDSIIRYPLTIVSETLCKKPNRTVYNYYFTYDSLRNINKLLLSKLPTVPGANHADELFYLFDPILYNLLPPTPKDRAMIRTMVDLWTSFAKTGEPADSNSLWCPSNEDSLKFYELNKNSSIIKLPNEDRIEFWRRTYNKYGRK